MIDLAGRTAVVTGGSRGIGRAIATTLGAAGAHVVVADRTDARRTDGGATSDLVRAAGGSAESVLLDVTDSAAVDRVIGDVAARRGIDILVNNAGVLTGGSVVETTDESWRALFAVNLDGTFFCMRAALRHMVAAGYGKVVNIASISGLRANPGFAGYCATKGAMVLLTKQAGIDYAASGVNVNAVAPGFVDTEMLAVYDASVRRALEGQTPNGRWATPQQIADSVLFLSSPLSDHVCGEILTVDGGWVVGTPVVPLPAADVVSA